MAIDVDRALGSLLPPATASWGPPDVILYHLGLGAGADSTSPRELSYTYEDGLQVLPTFGVILATPGARGVADVPGMDYDPAQMLHGEQEIEIVHPIPTSGTVHTKAHIAGLYDKQKAALTVVEARSEDDGGEVLFVNRFSLFMRGAGGFGGDPGPRQDVTVPDREPDVVVECPTLPQQALLYRLSGDYNPLHADPAVATKAGFERPILHGLCSFGIACKAVVDHLLHGDASSVARFKARFAGVVFPGETLVVRVWADGERILLDAHSRERGTPVLGNGLVRTRPT